MKRIILFVFLVFSVSRLSGLDYVESNNGLQNPELDGGATELEYADIDDDGNVDILSIGDHGSPYINSNQHGIMVWFGDGSGNWSVSQNGDFGYGGIAIGDVNNDGYKDVGYAMHHNYSTTDFGDQLIEVALGDGTGTSWTPWDDGLATSGETWGMFGTDFADIDNDGYLDIGSNSFGASAGVHVYRNNTDGTWTQTFGFIGGNSTMDFCFGDINKDGNADFVVNHQYGTVYFGDGSGAFTLADGNLPGGGTMGRYGTSLGDVDNDGGKDLAFVNSNGGVEVWLWEETEELWLDFCGTLPASGNYQKTQLCDMNADDFIDVAAFGDGNFTLWLGDSSGNWSQDAQFTTPPDGDCEAFRIGGDIDQNGYPDIVLVAVQSDWPSYQNHLYCFKENSTADALLISPVFPRGKEVFKQNSVQFIVWNSEVPAGVQSSVTLEYSATGSSGPWITIAENIKNNGKYQWNVPEITTSANCYLKLTVWTFLDFTTHITQEPFTILGGSAAVDVPEIENSEFVPQNFPNPFSEKTNIYFTLKHNQNTALEIYNIQGELVKKIERQFNQEENIYTWKGKDDQGLPVKNGIYFYKLKIGVNELTGKMILIK